MVVVLSRPLWERANIERDDCIQCRVELVDAAELCFDNFNCGRLTAANSRGHF